MTSFIDYLNLHETEDKNITEGKNIPEDLDDLIDLYMQQNRIYHLEGMRGVRYLHNIVEILGYRDFDYFLEDNPGCQVAIVEWIKEQKNDEWADNFKDAVDLSDDEGADDNG